MAAASKRWLARESALVRFNSDPTLLHWRLVLVCITGDRCLVATPDRDINDTVLEVGDTFSEVIRMDGDRLPRRIRERDTYLPRHSGGGELGTDELRSLTAQAEAMVDRIAPGDARRRVTGKVGRDGRVHGLGLASGADPQSADSRRDRDCWMVVFDDGGSSVGEERSPALENGSEVVLGGERYAIWQEDGRVFMAKQVHRGRLAALADLAKQSTSAAPAAERDVRILPVLFDVADERWRTITEALPELDEADFADWPLQGPRTLFRDLRQLRRLGTDFVQHHEGWVRKSGIRPTDRSVHEHLAICRALNLLVSYDQLNIVNIAGAEALNRRRTLIEMAHQGRPEAPSYAGAEEVLGVRESTDGSVVDPAITAYAAKRQAAKAEIQKQRRLAAEEQRAVSASDDKNYKGGGRGSGRGAAPKDEK